MIEAKFTPGPWKIAQTDPFADITAIGPLTAECSISNYGARVHNFLDISSDDARLISAAPDLYTALANLMRDCNNASYCIAADAALQKARGE